MTERGTPGLDPELEEWLAEARADESVQPPPELERLLGEVEKDIEAADRSWLFWLRSRATWARRAIAFAAAMVVVGVGGVLTLRADFGALPFAWTATAVGSLALLLSASLYVALRPLHQPELPGWQRAALVGGSLAATSALALLAPADAALAAGGEGFFAHVTPCLFYGLLLGVPVFLLLRVLDRGSSTVALIAACAAGLTGNLALQLHCPRTDAEHLMGAHVGVVVLFLAGLGAVHWLLRRRDRG